MLPQQLLVQIPVAALNATAARSPHRGHRTTTAPSQTAASTSNRPRVLSRTVTDRPDPIRVIQRGSFSAPRPSGPRDRCRTATAPRFRPTPLARQKVQVVFRANGSSGLDLYGRTLTTWLATAASAPESRFVTTACCPLRYRGNCAHRKVARRRIRFRDPALARRRRRLPARAGFRARVEPTSYREPFATSCGSSSRAPQRLQRLQSAMRRRCAVLNAACRRVPPTGTQAFIWRTAGGKHPRPSIAWKKAA